jgi:hypothetical protein
MIALRVCHDGLSLTEQDELERSLQSHEPDEQHRLAFPPPRILLWTFLHRVYERVIVYMNYTERITQILLNFYRAITLAQ